jgi:hypothetical protein
MSFPERLSEQLQAAADWQGLRFQIGDILMLRTGGVASPPNAPAIQ